MEPGHQHVLGVQNHLPCWCFAPSFVRGLHVRPTAARQPHSQLRRQPVGGGLKERSCRPGRRYGLHLRRTCRGSLIYPLQIIG